MPELDELDEARPFGEDPGAVDDESTVPTEEEQMNYDMLVIRARKMMFGKGRDNVLKLLGSSNTPAEGLGQAASMIVKSLTNAAKEAGREISGEVAINAGAEIVDDLSELAKSKGVYQYDSPEEEKQQIEEAMLYGVKHYGDGMIAAGELTPEIQEQAKQQVQEGLTEEQATKKTPVAAGVEQAMAEKQDGLIANAMGGV